MHSLIVDIYLTFFNCILYYGQHILGGLYLLLLHVKNTGYNVKQGPHCRTVPFCDSNFINIFLYLSISIEFLSKIIQPVVTSCVCQS